MVIKWLKELKESKAKEKAIEDYLQRLENSYEDFYGMSHISDGTKNKEYLTAYEFHRLIRDELKRLTK